MTMIWNKLTGNWEADVKDRMAGRVHLSLRTSVKRDATTRYAALVAFIREGDVDLINRLRSQKIHITAIERCVRDRVPFATLRAAPERWPTFDEASVQYVAWLEANENKADKTASTAKNQLAVFGAFDGIGGTRLDDITPQQVAAYQVWLAESGNDGKPYAVNSRTAYVGRVAALYSFMQEEEHRRAIRDGRQPRILHSPVDRRTQPRGHTHRERYLTPQEAEALLTATPDAMRFPIAAGLLGGMRVAEMQHLRPSDVDWTAENIAVQEKEWRSGNRPVYWKPKTKRSYRRINMSDELCAIARHHADRYASPSWLVPGRRDTTQPLGGAMFSLAFTRIVKDAGLWAPRGDPRAVSFHTLRHSFASWLVMAGESLLTVSKLLGNTAQMVEETYGHLAPEHRKKAVSRLSVMIAIPPALSDDPNGNGSHP